MEGQGFIVIRRRTLLQDAVRRHVVLIDGKRVAKLWDLQTGRYPVTPGTHTVRLAPREAIDWEVGRTSSDVIEVDVRAGDTLTLLDKPQEDVLRTNEGVIEQARLFLSQHRDPAGTVVKCSKTSSMVPPGVRGRHGSRRRPFARFRDGVRRPANHRNVRRDAHYPEESEGPSATFTSALTRGGVIIVWCKKRGCGRDDAIQQALEGGAGTRVRADGDRSRRGSWLRGP